MLWGQGDVGPVSWFRRRERGLDQYQLIAPQSVQPLIRAEGWAEARRRQTPPFHNAVFF